MRKKQRLEKKRESMRKGKERKLKEELHDKKKKGENLRSRGRKKTD